MRRPALPALAAALLAAPAAAQLTGPSDPSGTYVLNVVPAGADCPQMYPRAQIVLERRSGNEFAIHMMGDIGTLFYQRDRAALQGSISTFYGRGPVMISGSADSYQGQQTLDLNLRWTGIDCYAGATGGLEGAAPADNRSAEAAEVPTDVTAPPPAVIGPAGDAAAGESKDKSATAAQPDQTIIELRAIPFWLQLLLVSALAIGLGWLIGRLLARRRIDGAKPDEEA